MSSQLVSPPSDDARFNRPLCTLAQAAAWLDIPRTTLASWAAGRPLMTVLPAWRAHAAIPFVGLVEALVLGALRRAGVLLHRLRPALERLDAEMGVAHPLANDRLLIDGPDILYDFGARLDPGGIRQLIVVSGGQRSFELTVLNALGGLSYAVDHWADRARLPGYSQATVVVDPGLAGGRRVLEPSHVPLEDLSRRWIAGDSIGELADAFGLEPQVVEEVLRAALRRSANFS